MVNPLAAMKSLRGEKTVTFGTWKTEPYSFCPPTPGMRRRLILKMLGNTQVLCSVSQKRKRGQALVESTGAPDKGSALWVPRSSKGTRVQKPAFSTTPDLRETLSPPGAPTSHSCIELSEWRPGTLSGWQETRTRHGYGEATRHIPAWGSSIPTGKAAGSSAGLATGRHHHIHTFLWDQHRVCPTGTKPTATPPDASGDLIGKSPKGKRQHHGLSAGATRL